MYARKSLALLLSYTSAVLALKCYNVLGGEPADDSYQPCNPNATVSACCATNRANADLCMESGLCYSTFDPYAGYIYANGCTDSSGNDPACPHVCPAAANKWKEYNVLQCSEGTWCCREATDLANCCNNTNMIVDATQYNLGQFVTTPNTSSSTSGSDTTGSASSSSTTGSESHKAAVVGASVGAVLGVALLLALASLLWMLRKIRNLKKELQSTKQDTYHGAMSDTNTLSTRSQTQSPYYIDPHAFSPGYSLQDNWKQQRHEIGSVH